MTTVSRRTWVYVGLAALLVVSVSLIPTKPPIPQRATDLPWQMQLEPDGSLTVLGLTIGRSSLLDAKRRFDIHADVGLFANPDGSYSLEAFFTGVRLAGLNAKVILEADLTQLELAALAERHVGRWASPSGAVKLQLSEADILEIQTRPIRSISYIPKAKIDANLIRQRFGNPAETIQLDEAVSHWLYPEKGLDIIVNTQGPAIFQYVRPADFERIRQRIEGGEKAG